MCTNLLFLCLMILQVSTNGCSQLSKTGEISVTNVVNFKLVLIFNKKAFQSYRLLQWLLGVSVPGGKVSAQGGVCPQGSVCPGVVCPGGICPGVVSL